MLLKECLKAADLNEALNQMPSLPAFLGALNQFVFQKTKNFPEVRYRNFYMEIEPRERVYFCCKLYNIARVTPCLSIYCHEKLKLNNEIIYKALDEIRDRVPEFFAFDGGIVQAFEPILTEYCAWYTSRFPTNELKHYPTILYYMNEEQKQQLKNDYQTSIPLPEGYYFDDAEPEVDAELITKTWIHSGPGDVEATKAKLRNFPYSLTREARTKQAVAWEMTEFGGLLNHLFTLPEYRGKGLGSANEINLCLKLIADGKTPYKTVELFNEMVLASSDRSKYWTRWETDRGKPIEFLFLKQILKC